MTLDLMGIPTDLALYDSQGELLYNPDSNSANVLNPSQDSEYNVTQRTATEEEQQVAQSLLDLIRNDLCEVDDFGSNLSLADEVNVFDSEASNEDAYYSVTLNGGKNGHGLWSNYLSSLSDLMLRLESTFQDAYIRRFESDCPDDVFTVEIAFLPYVNQVE